jgi:hypothetical protein
MGKRQTVVTGLCLLVLALSAALTQAQQPMPPQTGAAAAQAAEDVRLSRMAIQLERQSIVTQAMDLTPEEMQLFWPLYREYRLEAARLGDRIVALIAVYADAYQNLSDDVADKLLNEFVSIEKERAGIKAKYLPRFKKVLPARKIARFYQLENKLDITILNEMAQSIPLAR